MEEAGPWGWGMGASEWAVGGASTQAVSRDHVSVSFPPLCLAQSDDGNDRFYPTQAPCEALRMHILM